LHAGVDALWPEQTAPKATAAAAKAAPEVGEDPAVVEPLSPKTTQKA
jgi:hypothetical protein